MVTNKPVIAIVGCGFIGSHLAEELPKLFFSQELGPFTFRFIDFDVWEERNSANQNVNQEDAKKEELKAITCARYASKYSDITAEPVTEKLTGANYKALLGDALLIIDAVDNIPTRQLLWGLAKSKQIGAVMHTGISRSGEGIINWSTPIYDTFPFKPNDVAGRELAPQDFKEPPCEMYKYRTAGLSLVQGIAKATAFYFGKDPWAMFGVATPDKGQMTCWNTTVKGAQILVDKLYLTEEGIFPVYYPLKTEEGNA